MTAAIPTGVRLRLAHAAVQFMAEQAGVDLLHIKGEALDASVRRPGRTSTDVDVLVRPADVAALIRVLRDRDWELRGGFHASSAFEHSATLHHPVWGYLDVHRRYPGFTVEDGEAFDVLWRDRVPWQAAGRRCFVPDLPAQRLVLLLHSARSAGSMRALADTEQAWTTISPEAQAQVTALAERLGAQVALAAATGSLSAWRDDPAHDLWRVLSTGGTRLDEWRARVHAAPTVRSKAALLGRATLVNVEHLSMVRGRPPSRREIVVEFFARPWRGLREELRRRPLSRPRSRG